MKPGISDTKRFIIEFEATKNAIVKIDSKLPQDAKVVTGVYFSFCRQFSIKYKGIIHLRFSEGISCPIMREKVTPLKTEKQKKIKYIPLNEPVSPASTLQGYYVDNSLVAVTYRVKIYVEYLPINNTKP